MSSTRPTSTLQPHGLSQSMRLRVVGDQLASGGDGGELFLWRAHMQQLNGEDTHWQRSILRHADCLPKHFSLLAIMRYARRNSNQSLFSAELEPEGSTCLAAAGRTQMMCRI
jgi:hypothetical protein